MKPGTLIAVGFVLAALIAGCGGTTRTVTKTVEVAPAKPATSTAKPATSTAARIVLGSKSFVSSGEGWGTAEPSRIYNGGDRSGLVTHIRWTKWGGPVALGTGLNAIFKPGGGYYGQPVTIDLRASEVGTCTQGGPRVYLQLSTREPERPGGPLGPWHPWSEVANLCSYESRISKSTATESTSTTTTPAAGAKTFHGNGVQNLGTITVTSPSKLDWSCSTCSVFSVTGSSEGGPVIALDSQKHSSGVTAVEPGTYHSVDVQAYGEAGVAGAWTITITPG